MDIPTQAEIVLRDALYETWPWSGGPVPTICFEDPTLVGFLHIFPSAESLLKGWEKAQESALGRHAVALRSAGNKAWNVYSVFLAEKGGPELNRRFERIEEDFSLARKIARANIRRMPIWYTLCYRCCESERSLPWVMRTTTIVCAHA
jgi:hypothetical protein